MVSRCKAQWNSKEVPANICAILSYLYIMNAYYLDFYYNRQLSSGATFESLDQRKKFLSTLTSDEVVDLFGDYFVSSGQIWIQ